MTSSIIQMITYIDGHYTKDMQKQNLRQEHYVEHYIHLMCKFPLHWTTQTIQIQTTTVMTILTNGITKIKNRCGKLLVELCQRLPYGNFSWYEILDGIRVIMMQKKCKMEGYREKVLQHLYVHMHFQMRYKVQLMLGVILRIQGKITYPELQISPWWDMGLLRG